MKCPACGKDGDKVMDSRPVRDGSAIRRRRECFSCQSRFTTYEYIEGQQISVIKSDGSREVFSRAKLERGLSRALNKRTHSDQEVQEAVDRIERRIQVLASATGDLPSHQLGETVLEELRSFDEVAYIRFASVYRRFQDVQEFIDALQSLDSQN
jgi:transcriptional repressor NrdR